MQWNSSRLDAVLAEMRARRGDTTTIEIKRAAGGVPSMPETICAFGNMPDGGDIILGVDEAGGRFDIIGVEDVALVEAGLASQARQAVSPSPRIEFQTLQVDGKHVLVAHVSPLRIADRPAYVGDRAFLRQSDGDYPMQPHELRLLEVAKLHADEQIDYDLAPASGRSRADLDASLTSAYLSEVRASDPRLSSSSDDEILQMTNVLSSSGAPTLAGLYALGRYPQGQYPALTVTAAVQLQGGEGQARNRNLRDFTGPVPVLLDELLAWVETNLDTIRRYRADGHMEAVSELPLTAVRELIANALVHRDLGPNTRGMGKQIQIRITSRSLFIQSPGGLRGLSTAQLESVAHAQAAVNQRLYQIAKRLRTPDGAKVIEGEGGGIREVFRSTAARGLPRPHLSDTGVQFTAALWRARDEMTAPPAESAVPAHDRRAPSRDAELPGLASTAPTRNEPAVLAALRREIGSSLTIHEIAEHARLSTQQVRYALAQPLADGLVVMDGGQGHRSTTYRLSRGEDAKA